MSSSDHFLSSPAAASAPLFLLLPPITTAPEPHLVVLRLFHSFSIFIIIFAAAAAALFSPRRPLLPPLSPLSPSTPLRRRKRLTPRYPTISLTYHRPRLKRLFHRILPRPLPSLLEQPWASPKIQRPPSVRLANPVNYVPRITPVTVPQPPQFSSESLPLESHRDAFPLLSIPERRRNRLTPSPNSLVVERSQYESESGRSSIAVPRQRPSGTFEYIPLEMETAVDRPGPGPDHPRHVQSQHSLRSQSQIASIPSNTDAAHEPDVAEELAWGPAHPCYPHINPHVPPGSDEYLTTRIIRIRRDWMVKGDLAPTFSNLYPEILDPLLPEQEFRRIIATINDELISAFDPFSVRNWLDGAIGLLTGWVWEDIGAPRIKSHLKRVEDWLERWNREVGAKDGVRIWSLRRTAYMSLDIQIPDPKVGIVASEGNPSRPGTRPDSRQ
ncbi:Golgin subfamily A member 7/ERF4 family-domain-containing protein [Aspergillus egyptiacus]|nr:Golgin subfamily A member 7/ERF4 family-domain-containing protein [Aspergillus egyptiacus]